jgi:hypothetical protein
MATSATTSVLVAISVNGSFGHAGSLNRTFGVLLWS